MLRFAPQVWAARKESYDQTTTRPRQDCSAVTPVGSRNDGLSVSTYTGKEALVPKAQTQKASKGIPRKSRSASRKARRIKNHSLQPERKLRHILHRMKGVTPPQKVREAFTWASECSALATLRQLCPDYQKVLQQLGQAV